MMMKKILFWCAAFAVMATGCAEVDIDNTPSVPSGKLVEYTLNVSAESTRALLGSDNTVTWEQADAELLGFVTDDNVHGHSTAVQVSDDGVNGSFTVTADENASTLLAYYPYNENAYADGKLTFTIAQWRGAIAPIKNGAAVGTKVALKEGALETKMTALNSIVKFLVYDTEGTFAGKNLNCVCIFADNVPSGTLTYDIATGETATALSYASYMVTDTPGFTVAASKEEAVPIYLEVLPLNDVKVNYYELKIDGVDYQLPVSGLKSYPANTVVETPINLAHYEAPEAPALEIVGSEEQSVEVEDVAAYVPSYVDESGIFGRAAAALGLDAVSEDNTVMYVLCEGDEWKTAQEVNGLTTDSWFNTNGYGCGHGADAKYDIHYAGDHFEGCPISNGLGGWSAKLTFAIALPDGSKMYKVELTVTIKEPEKKEYDIVKTSEYELSIEYKDGFVPTDITKYGFFNEALAALGVSNLDECTVYGVNTDGTFSNFSDDIWFDSKGNPTSWGNDCVFDFHAWDQNVCNIPDGAFIGWSQTITFGLVPKNNPDNKAALVKLAVTLNEPQAKDIQIVDTVKYTTTVKYNDSYTLYEVDYDYASIAATLGVGNVWTDCDIYYVNADMSFSAGPSTDNWFGADGNIAGWGDNAVLDLKYEGGEKFHIYCMPGETAASKCGTFTVRNAFVNDALQAVVFEATITVEE